MRLSAARASGRSVVPSAGKSLAEKLEAAPRQFADEFIAVGEMPIGRRPGDADTLGRFGEGEAGRTMLGDQDARRFDQRVLQPSMVIAAAAPARIGLWPKKGCL